MEHPVHTLEDFAKLLVSRPKVGLILATPETKGLFTVLGRLANFKGTKLTRFVLSGALTIDGPNDRLFLGVRALKGIHVQRLDLFFEYEN
jgi:hypothetical protein